jgi:hypothetical protein
MALRGGQPAFATLAGATAVNDENLGSLSALQHCLAAAGVRNAAGMPLRVRDQQALRGDGLDYEARILDTGVVAVRPGNWHDVFNVLVWCIFPHAKAALNECHCAALKCNPGGSRGAVRDALTLFDESGVIVLASDPSLLEAVYHFRWKELFWTRRAEFSRDLHVHVFGHSVYEKLLHPYVGLTGHAVLLDVAQAVIELPVAERTATLDRRLAAFFRKGETLRSPRDLQPVPLLGVPGWHPDTEREAFYDNRDYFRPGRGLWRKQRA